jgi:hypothetical protein
MSAAECAKAALAWALRSRSFASAHASALQGTCSAPSPHHPCMVTIPTDKKLVASETQGKFPQEMAFEWHLRRFVFFINMVQGCFPFVLLLLLLQMLHEVPLHFFFRLPWKVHNSAC